MKITEHIYFYPCKSSNGIRPSNTIVIVGDREKIMIDPGLDMKKRLKCLIDDMKKDGLDISKISEVWLTHNHPDHSYLASIMARRFRIKVRAHWLAKKILEAKYPIVALELQQMKAAGRFFSIRFCLGSDTFPEVKKIPKLLTWKQTRVGQPFFDGEKVLIEPLEVYVFSLPGHCPDEIGFWIPKERVLIIGDLIHPLNDDKFKLPVLNNFVSDSNQAISSIEKMKKIKNWTFRFFPKLLQPKVLLPAHGKQVIGRKNIQKIFDNILLEIEKYKGIAKDFVQKNPDFKGVSLVNKLAEVFAKRICDNPSLVIICEMRFIAFTTLKSLGVIK